jgi:hypothetical protein
VDYRKLNDITRNDCLQLSQTDDTLDTLDETKWFSTADLKSGYWQVDMHLGDKEKTVFYMGQRIWHVTVVPFGLCNAPEVFERLMETDLRGLTTKSCLVYLDDMIVLSHTLQEHLLILLKVCQQFQEVHLRLNPEKFHLSHKEVWYSEHIVSPEGITTNFKKLRAIQEWSIPKNIHEFRSFLGLCTYFRFCQHPETANQI